MIRIIKEGDLTLLNDTIQFTCPYCTCIFEADLEDLIVDTNKTIMCFCPTCKKKVYKYKEDQ